MSWNSVQTFTCKSVLSFILYIVAFRIFMCYVYIFVLFLRHLRSYSTQSRPLHLHIMRVFCVYAAGQGRWRYTLGRLSKFQYSVYFHLHHRGGPSDVECRVPGRKIIKHNWESRISDLMTPWPWLIQLGKNLLFPHLFVGGKFFRIRNEIVKIFVSCLVFRLAIVCFLSRSLWLPCSLQYDVIIFNKDNP